MNKHVLTLALLLISTGAYALDCGNIAIPPAQYRQPMTTPPIVYTLTRDRVALACRDSTFRACSFADSNIIVLPGDATPIERFCLILHESAHLAPNLWPADHPGATFGQYRP